MAALRRRSCSDARFSLHPLQRRVSPTRVRRHRAATSAASTRVRPAPGVAAVDAGSRGRLRSLRERDYRSARHSRAQEESLRPVTTAVTNKRMTRFPGQADVDVLALKLRRCLNDHIFWEGNSSASKLGRIRRTFRHRACARRQICAFDHQWMRAGWVRESECPARTSSTRSLSQSRRFTSRGQTWAGACG